MGQMLFLNSLSLHYLSFTGFHLILPISYIRHNSIYTTAKSFNGSQGGSPVDSAFRMRHLPSTSSIYRCWAPLFYQDEHIPLFLSNGCFLNTGCLCSAVIEFTDGQLNLCRLKDSWCPQPPLRPSLQDCPDPRSSATTYGNSDFVLTSPMEPPDHRVSSSQFSGASEFIIFYCVERLHHGADTMAQLPSRGSSVWKSGCHFRRWTLTHPDHMASRHLGIIFLKALQTFPLGYLELMPIFCTTSHTLQALSHLSFTGEMKTVLERRDHFSKATEPANQESKSSSG